VSKGIIKSKDEKKQQDIIQLAGNTNMLELISLAVYQVKSSHSAFNKERDKRTFVQ